jgi:hypothetical protein
MGLYSSAKKYVGWPITVNQLSTIRWPRKEGKSMWKKMMMITLLVFHLTAWFWIQWHRSWYWRTQWEYKGRYSGKTWNQCRLESGWCDAIRRLLVSRCRTIPSTLSNSIKNVNGRVSVVWSEPFMRKFDISSIRAAGFPATNLTAYFAMYELCHPRPNKFHLIHSAAGGVVREGSTISFFSSFLSFLFKRDRHSFKWRKSSTARLLQ